MQTASTTDTVATPARVLSVSDYAFRIATQEMQIAKLESRIEIAHDDLDFWSKEGDDKRTQRATNEILRWMEEREAAKAQRDAFLADYLSLIGK